MRWYKSSGYIIQQPIDPEQHPAREGLEGPFRMRNGKVLYYDPREGKYYDASTDMYLSNDEMTEMDQPRIHPL